MNSIRNDKRVAQLHANFPWRKPLATALLALAVLEVAAHVDLSDAGFSKRQEKPELGSNLRKHIGFSNTPLEKPCSELDEISMARFRCQLKS